MIGHHQATCKTTPVKPITEHFGLLLLGCSVFFIGIACAKRQFLIVWSIQGCKIGLGREGFENICYKLAILKKIPEERNEVQNSQIRRKFYSSVDRL